MFKRAGKLLNVGLMFIWKYKVSTFQASLPSLLGIVEPSDKIDIIFHHANEMTNTVVCHFCPYLAACLILKAFLTQLFFRLLIFRFQG